MTEIILGWPVWLQALFLFSTVWFVVSAASNVALAIGASKHDSDE